MWGNDPRGNNLYYFHLSYRSGVIRSKKWRVGSKKQHISGKRPYFIAIHPFKAIDLAVGIIFFNPNHQ
jgi:hypothetical protein